MTDKNPHPLESVVDAIKCAITLRNIFGGNTGGGKDIYNEALTTLREYMTRDKLAGSYSVDADAYNDGYKDGLEEGGEDTKGYEKELRVALFSWLVRRTLIEEEEEYTVQDILDILSEYEKELKVRVYNERVDGLADAVEWYTKIPPKHADSSLAIILKAARIQLKRQEG